MNVLILGKIGKTNKEYNKRIKEKRQKKKLDTLLNEICLKR